MDGQTPKNKDRNGNLVSSGEITPLKKQEILLGELSRKLDDYFTHHLLGSEHLPEQANK